jgi:uncharacterized protein (TIGR03790 family)
MNFIRLTFLLLLAPLAVRAGGDEVVVIYNSQVPASRTVAAHYAAARQVPASQIFGFALTTNEVITREDFTDFLQQPLAEKLAATGLWKFGPVDFPANGGQPAHTDERVVSSKIRYAVLCYGVPLKIAPSSNLEGYMDKFIEKFADESTREKLRHNEAAVDSELAWLPLVKMKVPLTGPLMNPFYLCTNRAALNCTNGILLVSRLDGPTPEIASGLVDKALAAESNGLWGRAYFDTRNLPTNDVYFLGDLWLLAGAEVCREVGFDTAVDTNADTLPESYPLSQVAIYAGWYDGDVSGPFKLPQVEFMPGAFAYHQHSFSGETLRSATSRWCGPLLSRGVTCTMGCVYEPYLQFMPNTGFFLQAFCSGYTFGEAAWAAQVALSWQTTVIGDPLYQPFKKTPPELHAQLARAKNPLIEWSFERLVNLDLTRGLRAPQLENFLENLPATSQSAVLTEKLADIYDSLGKPSSAIAAWQRALKLNPSPQQRIRLRLTLADKLPVQDRPAEAAADCRLLLAEAPDYPGQAAVKEKLKALEQKIAAETKP